MTRHFFVPALLLFVFVVPNLFAQQTENKSVSRQSIYDFKMQTIDSQTKSLSDYKGKVLMVVNVASFCGQTPQYKDLEAVYRKYKDKGFAVLAFPAKVLPAGNVNPEPENISYIDDPPESGREAIVDGNETQTPRPET